MAQYLKQSTAKVISFGPFVNPTDGVTLVTSLVSAIDNGSTGIFLSKNGGALTIRHASVTASTYDAYGNYLVTLDTTDTNTLGTLRVQFAAAASCLPVWRDFTVVPANIYDSIVGGTDLLDVSLVQVNGAAQTATLDTIKTVDDAVKAKTDNLPASPAAVGSAMTLTAAYDAAKTAAQAGDTMKVSSGTGAGQIDITSGVVSADIKKVNAIAVNGAGTAGSPWGP